MQDEGHSYLKTLLCHYFVVRITLRHFSSLISYRLLNNVALLATNIHFTYFFKGKGLEYLI